MATTVSGARARGDTRFFTITSLAMIAVIFVGFAPSFYLRGVIPNPNSPLPITPLVMAHGLIFTAWLGLYVTQVWLAASGRIDLHRRLGQLGWLFLPLLAGVGLFTALMGVGRGSAPPGIPVLSWLAMPLFDIPLYTLFIALAMRGGTPRPVHKRLMYLALTVMMVPGLGRVPVAPAFIPLTTLVLPSLFIVALLWWDVASRGRPMRVTMVGGATILVLWIAKPLIWSTAPWLAFAAWVSGPFT